MFVKVRYLLSENIQVSSPCSGVMLTKQVKYLGSTINEEKIVILVWIGLNLFNKLRVKRCKVKK